MANFGYISTGLRRTRRHQGSPSADRTLLDTFPKWSWSHSVELDDKSMVWIGVRKYIPPILFEIFSLASEREFGDLLGAPGDCRDGPAEPRSLPWKDSRNLLCLSYHKLKPLHISKLSQMSESKPIPARIADFHPYAVKSLPIFLTKIIKLH